MPGLITGMEELDRPSPPTGKTQKIVATILALCVLVIAPTASAATSGSNPNRVAKKVFLPKPGWEVDRIGVSYGPYR